MASYNSYGITHKVEKVVLITQLTLILLLYCLSQPPGRTQNNCVINLNCCVLKLILQYKYKMQCQIIMAKQNLNQFEVIHIALVN